MSTITAPAPLFDLPLAPEREQDDAACSDGDGLTLEQRLQSVWEGLSAVGASSCPVCRGRLERTAAGRGQCVSCGATLS